jgi:Flp pilus assembly protein TadD
MTSRGALFASLLLASTWFASPLPARPQKTNANSPINTVAAHLGKGYELVKDERYQEAATEFQAALVLDPNHARARYQLAVCWFASFRFPEARSEFNHVLRQIGNDPMAVYYLGRIDLAEGDADSAIRRLRSLTSNPPFPDTAYYLGSAYMAKGDFREAEKWLRRAAVATPRDFRVHDHLGRVYQRLGRRADAEREYALSSQLRVHVNEASRLATACSMELEAQDLREERASCRRLFDSRDPDKLATLGLLYGRHGFFAEAVDPLEQAARLDPDSSEIQHDLGLTYFRLRRYREARAPLEKAVALRPDFFGSCALLGATLYALGEHRLSYPTLRHAHELDPRDQDTARLLYSVAVLLAQTEFKDKRIEECLHYLQVAAEAHPTDPEVRRRLAEIYGLLGRRAEAAREQAEADRLARDHSQ